MIYNVIISKQAELDLRGIYEYIAFELRSPENAKGQLERLEDKIFKLESFPEKYRLYENEPWKSRGLRILPVDHYVVLYIPSKEKQTVTIIRIMYGGRDIDWQLGNRTDR